MAEIERILFDFEGDGGIEDAEKLESILSADRWSSRGLNYEDEQTKLLIHLLRIGGIKVFKREYTRKTDEPEIRRRANQINLYMKN
jgi:hypothetical protein